MIQEESEIRTLTSTEEQLKRFEFINGQFMSKYLDLVWYARSDEKELLLEEIYGGVAAIKRIENEYPKDTMELAGSDGTWHHGFNSGILAYARFLSSYIQNQLIEVDDIDGEIHEDEKIIVYKGKKYIELDGRQQAFDSFPELDT